MLYSKVQGVVASVIVSEPNGKDTDTMEVYFCHYITSSLDEQSSITSHILLLCSLQKTCTLLYQNSLHKIG